MDVLDEKKKQKQIAPYGTWSSPITPDIVTRDDVAFDEVTASPDGTIFLLESRPAEQGRSVIVEVHKDGRSRDVLPKGYSASTSVHGYGGGAFTALTSKTIIFSDGATNGVFLLETDSLAVTPVLEAHPDVYFASFCPHPVHADHVVAVREDHRGISRPGDAIDTLVTIQLSTGRVQTLASGADFYSQPSFNPTGTRISWTQWNHPDMPWTGNELYTASWQDGRLADVRHIAGKAVSESVSQPRWGPNGVLYFLCDRDGGFYQFWSVLFDGKAEQPRPVLLNGLELGELSMPEWRNSWTSYAILTQDLIIATWNYNATPRLVLIDSRKLTFKLLDMPLTDMRARSLAKTSTSSVAVVAATPTSSPALYTVDIFPDVALQTLRRSSSLSLPETCFSYPEHISFTRTTGKHKGTKAHTWFLPPQNPDYAAPADTLPPLILVAHGGPTGQVTPGLSLRMQQYWTSRGYAVAAINYGGSSGYGRAYRELMDGEFGVIDSADAADLARHLAEQGRVDGARIGVTGASAGGYLTNQAIAHFADIWAGAVSVAGIADFAGFDDDTHKFESRYMDRLLYGVDKPDERAQKRILHDRSPVHYARRVRAPTLFVHGARDDIVPWPQAQRMVAQINAAGGRADALLFDDEGHGYPRKADNALRALLAEQRWWHSTLVENAGRPAGSTSTSSTTSGRAQAAPQRQHQRSHSPSAVKIALALGLLLVSYTLYTCYRLMNGHIARKSDQTL